MSVAGVADGGPSADSQQCINSLAKQWDEVWARVTSTVHGVMTEGVFSRSGIDVNDYPCRAINGWEPGTLHPRIGVSPQLARQVSVMLTASGAEEPALFMGCAERPDGAP